MFSRFKILAVLFLIMYSCSENPINPPIELPITSLDTFNISGKILSKDGKSVAGIRAALKKYKLSAISNNDGIFTIKGVGNVSLMKTKGILSDTSDTLTDTLIINLGYSETDSITLNQIEVKSGIIISLPPEYIVQRNISGSLMPEDTSRVEKVIAVVYDVSFPNELKRIELWHDKINQEFNSFCYFSSDTGKQYCVFVEIYDTNNIFLGKSPNFLFTDKTGDINFKQPFKYNNGTPTINVTTQNIKYIGDTLQLIITVKDTFGTISNYSLKYKDSMINVIDTNNLSAIVDTILLIADSTTFNVKLSVTNNFGNIGFNTVEYSVLPIPTIIPHKIGNHEFGDTIISYFSPIKQYTYNPKFSDTLYGDSVKMFVKGSIHDEKKIQIPAIKDSIMYVVEEKFPIIFMPEMAILDSIIVNDTTIVDTLVYLVKPVIAYNRGINKGYYFPVFKETYDTIKTLMPYFIPKPHN